uniref:Tetratricopeptide repeat protein 38 n=2 Tax=Parascaris TaxID=6254 RepID=A0A915B5C3_PARUN
MASWCAENLRDCQAWKDEGLTMSTTSNEASRLFDGLLRQYVSWSNCEQLDGIDNTINALQKADPDAIMGRVLILGLDAMGTSRSSRLDKQYADEMTKLLNDANRIGNQREKSHAKAINLFANDQMIAACQEWENILRETPNDLLALKFAHDAYFYLGDSLSIKDSVGRVLPSWNVSTPCYSYLHGMYAFGLEECKEYDKAENEALKGLELRREDAWATHARAHCMEMNGRFNEGIAFMESTMDDWNRSSMLACHNYWHTALFYLEREDYDTVLSYYDSEIGVLSKSGAMLDLVDAASILFRLHMEGVDVSNRWNALLPIAQSHMDDHILAFNDAHFRLITEGCGIDTIRQQHRKSIRGFISTGTGDNCRITRQIGETVCEAISAYWANDFDAVISRLAPIRKKICEIGGSNAQRDIFTQILINSCLRSSNENNNRLAKVFIEERFNEKKNSLISERLMARFKALNIGDKK